VAVALLVLTPHAWGTSKYKVLHNFGAGKDGPGSPSGPLLLVQNGNVYGNTYSIAFELTPQPDGKWKEAILHAFSSEDGAPWGALVSDSAGNLYGTTVGQGGNSEVFELSPGTHGWTLSALYTDGAGPGILMDKSGNFYGAIGGGNYFGIGAIGELSRGSNGWSYTDLANFNPTVGYSPPAPPIWDGKGNLFGTTTDGGISQPACWTSNGCGVIFEITPNGDGTWAYHILHRFASYPTDGRTPYGGLVMDVSGNFYGTTEYGGSKRNGTVFKLSSVSGHWKKTVVYDFPDWHNGALPNSTLVLDKAGNLYGIGGGGNQGCGPYTCGVVFKLAPQKNGQWKYSPVHKFSGPDGNFPVGVIVDDKGNIFGTTANGGTYNSGVAFEITP
jgi:uncharacterized repeat protein (TIGR03803 family)